MGMPWQYVAPSFTTSEDPAPRADSLHVVLGVVLACAIDVTLNASIIFVITSHDNGSNQSGYSSSANQGIRRERDEAKSAWSRREEGHEAPLAASTPGYFPGCGDGIPRMPVVYSSLTGGVRRGDLRRERGDGGGSDGQRPQRWSGVEVSSEVEIKVEELVEIRRDYLKEEREGDKGDLENEAVDLLRV